MKPKQYPKQSVLAPLFRYDSESGLLYSRVNRGQTIKKNDLIGYQNDGYLRTTINGSGYYVHRLIWIIVHGDISSETCVDHINGNTTDNRLCNLRAVTMKENARNMKKSSRNKTGIVGIHFDKRLNKYRVQIGNNKKNVHVGLFDSLESAIIARQNAQNTFEYHPNHGRR